jgi:SpoIIAA-like
MIALFGWVTPGEVRHFPLAQRDDAIAWAAA